VLAHHFATLEFRKAASDFRMQCRSFDLRNEPLSDFDSQVRSRPLSDAGRRCGKSRVSGHDRDPRQRADAGPEVDRATAVEVRVDDATVAPIALRGWEQRALRGALLDRERPLLPTDAVSA